MVCSKCGNQVLDGNEYCGHCGNKVEIESIINPVEDAVCNEIVESNKQINEPQLPGSPDYSSTQQNELIQPQISLEQPSEHSKSNKKSMKVPIIILASIISFVIAIILLVNIFPSVDINSNTFVINWNKLANESTKNLTCGVVISNADGEHSYNLGKGCLLEYTIDKPTLAAIGNLYTVTLTKTKFMDSGTQKLVEKFISIIGCKCDEKVLAENFIKSTKNLIPDAVTGVEISWDTDSSLNVTAKYLYDQQYEVSTITGLNFGITFDEYIKNYNAIISSNTESKYKSDVADSEYINCAQTLVYNNLKAPATSNCVSSSVLDKDEYGRAVVLLEVDAENSFGALIRTDFCVVIQGINYDGTYDYDKINCLQTYTSSTQDMVVEIMKNLNDFGKPRSNKSLISSSDFSRTSENGITTYSKDSIFNILVDEETNKVFSVQIVLNKDSFQNETDEESSNLETNISYWIQAAIAESQDDIETTLSNCFDFKLIAPIDNSYENGVLYETYEDNLTYICVTALSASKYEYLNSQSFSSGNVLDLLLQKEDTTSSTEPETTTMQSITDYSKFVGQWSNGDCSLTITNVSGNLIEANLAVQSSGSNQIAKCSISGTASDDVLSFTFDDDGWGNSGTGTLTFSNKSISVHVETTNNPNSKFSMGSFDDVLY